MEDRLYFRNGDQKIFIVKSAEGDPLNLIDPLSLKDAGSAPADSLTKIGTNNALRRTLRTTVAHFALVESRTRPCGWTRCETCCGRWTTPTVALLRERIGVETNSSVKKEIATGLALAALDGSDSQRASRRYRHAQPKRQPGCAQQAGAPAR